MFNSGVFRKGWKKDDSVLIINTLMGPESNALQFSSGKNGRRSLIGGCGLCSFISEVLSHHRTLPFFLLSSCLEVRFALLSMFASLQEITVGPNNNELKPLNP